MRVGLLTGGGDVPGLNAAIRAVVKRGELAHGHSIVGFRNGWKGVVEGDVGRPLRLLDVNVLRTSAEEHVSMRLVHIERGIEAWLDEHSSAQQVAPPKADGPVITAAPGTYIFQK